MSETKDLQEAVGPAISAGLGALMLKRKMKSIAEGKDGEGTTILNFGNSGSVAQSSSGSSGTHDDKDANASAMKIEGAGNGKGFAQKTTQNIFQSSTKDPNASTLVGVPNMPPSSS